MIDVAIRESFLLLDAVDRRTLDSLELVGLQTPLTCSQFHALVALEQDPGQSLSALAKTLLCAKANASGVVDRLSRAALVEKEPDPNDARRIRLKLTAAGVSLLAIARRRRHEEQAKVLTEFERAHGVALDEVARIMDRLVKHLRKTSVPAATAPRPRRRLSAERPRHGGPAKRGRARR